MPDVGRGSLRWRFAVWFGLAFVFGAVGLRTLHYQAASRWLAHELDLELRTRLSEVAAVERATPGDLDHPGLELPEGFAASGPAESPPPAAADLFRGLSVGLPPLDWFAGIWQPDGTLVASRRLPEQVGWDPTLPRRLGKLWTTPDGRFRLAAMSGSKGSLLVVGTSLTSLAAARNRAAWFQAATFILWVPLLLGIAWLLLGRVLAPLRGIAATARRIHDGRFEERIDLAQADTEYADVAATLNAMLDRLDAIRGSQARFNADVAHQLMNPVHSILLESDVATSQPRPAADLAAALNRVGTLGRRLEALCEALLTYARSASIDPSRLRRLDLEPILAEAAEQVAPQAANRSITISLPTGGAMARGDAELLREVFANLLANAVEHSVPGGSIEVRAASTSTTAQVSVIDHGHGVSPADAPRIFDRFWSDKPGGGHGVGLALCRTILRSHGGDIVFETTPGGGATFVATLPAAESQAGQVSGEEPLEPA